MKKLATLDPDAMKPALGDLEAEADRGGHNGDDQERVERRAVNRGGNLDEVGGVGEAVEQADSEEKKCCGHSTEEEVLDGGFPGLRAALAEGREDVEGEAQEFKRDEDDQEILRSYEEHHSRSCDEDEQDELADVFGECGVDGDQQCEDREDEQRDLDEMNEGIGNQHPVEDVCLHRRQQNSKNCTRTAEGRERGSNGEAGPRWRFPQGQKIDRHHDQCCGDDDDLRHREPKELRVVDCNHCQLPLRKPSNSGEFSAGTMTFRSICG